MATRSNPAAPRKTWRRLAKWLAAVILLLALITIALIHSAPVQQLVLRQLEGLAKAAGHGFSAKNLRVRPFDLEFSLSGFVYDNRGVRVEVDELTADVPWNIYRRQGLALNSLSADGLRITITSPEPVLPEPSGEVTRIPQMWVQQLHVRNARFSYANGSTRVDVVSFEIDAADGKGTLKLPAPVTISPGTTFRIPEVSLNLTQESVLFGPAAWVASYSQRSASGSAGGAVRWAPSIGANINFQTQPLTIEKWDRIVLEGVVRYEDGTLNLEGFRASRGDGELTGSAKITDQNKSAKMAWNKIRIDPTGVRGVTSGHLDLQWNASDLSDIGGDGQVTVAMPQYGNATGNVDLNNGRARINLRGMSMGADIRATVNTGLDRRLSGNFRLAYNKYGPVTAEGRLRGTLASPLVDARLVAEGVVYDGVGPLNGTAMVAYRQNILDITGITASLKQSTIPDGRLRINLKSKSLDGSIPEVVARIEDVLADGFGEIHASALISGSLDHPVGTFIASSNGFDIGGTHIDSVRAEAALEDDLLQVTRLTALQKEGSLEASGTFNLSTEQIDGRARVSNLQITEIRDLSATLNLEAELSGTYREPSASLRGELADVVYAGQQHGLVAVTGGVNRQTAELRLQSAKYNAVVEGSIAVKEPYAFSASVDARRSPIEYGDHQFTASGRIRA
ncbi:MAG TPA: hypothetical protein VFR18_00920, partial [Terriglobia bacterium]|nr:hypothetical protein [Terriglobia bacterium]